MSGDLQCTEGYRGASDIGIADAATDCIATTKSTNGEHAVHWITMHWTTITISEISPQILQKGPFMRTKLSACCNHMKACIKAQLSCPECD